MHPMEGPTCLITEELIRAVRIHVLPPSAVAVTGAAKTGTFSVQASAVPDLADRAAAVGPDAVATCVPLSSCS
jgi:hypothetical protein